MMQCAFWPLLCQSLVAHRIVKQENYWALTKVKKSSSFTYSLYNSKLTVMPTYILLDKTFYQNLHINLIPQTGHSQTLNLRWATEEHFLIFPHSYIIFSHFSLIFLQFFLNSVLWVGSLPTREGPGFAIDRRGCLLANEMYPHNHCKIILMTCIANLKLYRLCSIVIIIITPLCRVLDLYCRENEPWLCSIHLLLWQASDIVEKMQFPMQLCIPCCLVLHPMHHLLLL